MRRLRRLLRSFGLSENRLEFVYEIPDVLKFTIHAGEAYICDLVEKAEKLHKACPKDTTGNLAFVRTIEFGFKCCEHALDILFCHGPFPACLGKTSLDFIPIKGFFFTIFFHNSKKLSFKPFVCCESFFATKAFTTAANARSVITSSRIYDSVIVCTTEWTTHCKSS
tara:strand:- start:2037 stop:2537 length:501 start_codon:yes stop_codon:yes gene_type:complete